MGGAAGWVYGAGVAGSETVHACIKNGKIDVLSPSESCKGTVVNLLTDASTAANARLLGGLGPEAFLAKGDAYTKAEADASEKPPPRRTPRC